jgi:hypothetical protein
MNDQVTSEYVTESIGFKTILTGFGGNIVATLVEINWMTILTILLMIGGGVIQVLAYFRGRRTEMREKEAAQREKEAELREKEKHDLEVALLKKKLEDKE